MIMQRRNVRAVLSSADRIVSHLFATTWRGSPWTCKLIREEPPLMRILRASDGLLLAQEAVADIGVPAGTGTANTCSDGGPDHRHKCYTETPSMYVKPGL